MALANTNGCPLTTAVAGVPVTFSAPASGASGTFSASGSNSVTVGTTRPAWRRRRCSRQRHRRAATRSPRARHYGTVSFALTNTRSGIAGDDQRGRPARQSATRRDALTRSRSQVRVLDAGRQPVQGASVTFALGAGRRLGRGRRKRRGAGATFADGTTQATETTDANGVATLAALQRERDAGRFTATASTGASGGTV